MKPPVPPEAEILKIVAIVSAMPLNTGNHELFKLYKDAGGTAAWKSFRRGVALTRGGAEAEAEAERMDEENDRAARIEATRIEQEKERERRREKAAAREKRKEEEMARREELSRGQRVFVKVMYAGHLKLRPATVNNVMRGAVNVQIDNEEQPRTVRFNEVETSAEAAQQSYQANGSPPQTQQYPRQPQQPQIEYRRPQQPRDERDERDGPLLVGSPPKTAGAPLTAVPPAFAALGRQQPEPPKVVVPPPVIVPPSSPPQPEDTLSKVSAWIEQGSAMRENLVKQQASLQAEMDELALEVLRIEEVLTGKRAEQLRVTALLNALDQMRAAAA